MISGVVAVEDDGAQGARRLMGVHNEGLHYANSRAVDLYLITLTGRSFIWISHPRECARVQLMLGWFLLPFYKGGELLQRVFFPPSSSSSSTSSRSLLFRQSRRVDVAFSTREDKLLQLYHALTRSLFMANLSLLSILFFHSSLLFLIPENDDAKEIFLPPRKINTWFESRGVGSRRDLCAPVPPQTGAVVQSRFVTTRLHARWYCGCLSGARIFRYTWKYVGERVNRAA